MRLLNNFILFLNSSLFFMLSTCHWSELSFNDSIEIELAKKREQKNSYSYRDFKQFKRELKSLSFYRLSLVVGDKSEEEQKRRRVWDNLQSRIQNKTFYKYSLAGDSDLPSYIRNRYDSLSRYINYFETIYAKEETTIDDFLKKSNGKYAYIYVFYDYVTGDLMAFKNKYGDLRKHYKDFDILVLKEGISKLARMIVFHSPLSYNDLEFLFEEADQYFEISP